MLGHLPTSINLPPEAGSASYPPSSSPTTQSVQPADFISGVAAYRRHPYRRDLIDPPVIWSEGGSRILDFSHASARGTSILFVPSLINRAYVLDLAEHQSGMRLLAAYGFQVRLLDWGWPGPIERGFNLTDYVAGRLERAINFITPDQSVVLVGYCMGGLLALAAAQRQHPRVAGLALLATPWDFRTSNPGDAGTTAMLTQLVEAGSAKGTLSVDALQTVFALYNKGGVAAKFAAFSRSDPNSQSARMFVALEDWLSDGVPLASPVARDCLIGWYLENRPILGEWRIAGQQIAPESIHMPCFLAIPKRDKIVPPESARPLAKVLAGSVSIEPETGHVAMVAGARAERLLWRPFIDWLHTL